MPFLGDGVGFGLIHPAQHFDGAGLYFAVLAAPLGGHQNALYAHRAARTQEGNLAVVVGQGGLGDHLQGRQGAAVADVDEGEAAFRNAASPHPARNRDLAAQFEVVAEHRFDGVGNHGIAANAFLD